MQIRTLEFNIYNDSLMACSNAVFSKPCLIICIVRLWP